MDDLIQRMHRICVEHILPAGTGAVFPEPYYPYVPTTWNRILVLAEAQNLSDPNDAYVQELEAYSQDERIRRLYMNEWVSIQPWHDGSLPLAPAALFPEEEVKDFGVSNAVLWSLRAAPGRNANPDDILKNASKRVWGKFFQLLKPRLVIAAGAVAREVIHGAFSGPWFDVRLPSPNGIGRIVNMFDTNDLLERYPEVRTALAKHDWIAREGHFRNKVLFACHVVSRGRPLVDRMVAAGA